MSPSEHPETVHYHFNGNISQVECEVGKNKATFKGHEGKAFQKENNIFFEGETAVRLANAPTAPWGFQVWFRARSLLRRKEEKIRALLIWFW